jgi:uncharacterized protein (TIGR03437 family)
VGNSAINLSVAGLATGPVDRVWYSGSGSLLAHTASGRVFETSDFESWHPASAAVPAEPAPRIAPAHLPDANARIRAGLKTEYAVDGFAWRSDSNGAGWDNLTAYHGQSIVGELTDLAVSPSNDDEVAVGGSDGVFRSMDGGKSWSSLNQSLPNLPATRLLSLPEGDQGVRIALADGSAVSWAPGQKIAWTPADNFETARENMLRQHFSPLSGTRVTALATAGDAAVYMGMPDGKIGVSFDGGSNWRTALLQDAGAVERFWIDPADSRIAIAVFGARTHDSSVPAIHVERTIDGTNWDNLTTNLPDVAVHGVAADLATGAIYLATSSGVYMGYTSIATLGTLPSWQPLPGLNQVITDVKLDDQGHQLWAATEGYGVYATIAPHRMLDPRVVSTADQLIRATAPGGLVSVLGARLDSARAGDTNVPVLAASDAESQLQIPFELTGSAVSLAVNGSSGARTLPSVPLQSAAPAIFVDPDGSPVLLDADSGVMLDAMNPAHSRGRIQILATGLGRVNPDWPTGIPAPQENPPQVAAPVTAYIDRQPVEVTRAVLAPYVGFYLVEIEVPKIVNSGPAELYINAGGAESNRVRVYIQP